jgi:deaminated glutathione amidase
MKVAAIQMVSGVGVQANLETAHRLLRQAAAEGAELAVLPEYFCVMGQRDTDKLKFQEAEGSGPIQAFLAGAARELGLWIVGGTMPMATAYAARSSGRCVARYDKMHLFRFAQGQEDYDETRVLDAGTQPVSFALQSADGNTYTVGMSVCYDLRFPELYRALKADVILVPSAFTFTTGKAHWEVLLRARAIENQAYVLAAAQGGIHENGRRTWGHTMVVDAWGQITAQQDEGCAVVMGEVLRSELDAVRARLPALSHRVL